MIILFRRVLLDRRIHKKVLHHAIQWDTSKGGRMFAVSWAIEKGDWWKDRNEEKAKFISCNWRKRSNEYIRTGLYIGRLAIVWQTKPKVKNNEQMRDMQ